MSMIFAAFRAMRAASFFFIFLCLTSYSLLAYANSCKSILSQFSYELKYDDPHSFIVISDEHTDYFVPYLDGGLTGRRQRGFDVARDNLMKSQLLQSVLTSAGVVNMKVNPGIRALRLYETIYSPVVQQAYSQVHAHRHQLARKYAIRRIFGYDETEESIAEAREQLEELTGEPIFEPPILIEETDDHLSDFTKNDLTALDGVIAFDRVKGRSLEEVFNDPDVLDRTKMEILHKFNSTLKTIETFLRGEQTEFELDNTQPNFNEAEIEQDFGVSLGPADAPLYPYDISLRLRVKGQPIEIYIIVSGDRIIYGDDGIFYIRQFE